MRARDLMQTRLITIGEGLPVEDVADIFVRERISGAPVIDSAGHLVGIISREDVFFGSCTLPADHDSGEELRGTAPEAARRTRARDVMTSPAIFSSEDTPIEELASLMWRLRLHRVPIVKDDVVTGIVSSMDLCRVISQRTRLPEATAY